MPPLTPIWVIQIKSFFLVGIPTGHLFLEDFPTGDIISLLSSGFPSAFCPADILLPPIKYIDISIANKFVSGTRAWKRLLLGVGFHISAKEKKKHNLKIVFVQLQI